MEQDKDAKSLLAQIDGRTFSLQIKRVDGKADPRFESLISAAFKIIPEDIQLFFPQWEKLKWVEFAGNSEIPAGYYALKDEYCAYLYSESPAITAINHLVDFEDFMNKISNNY